MMDVETDLPVNEKRRKGERRTDESTVYTGPERRKSERREVRDMLI